MNQFRCYYDDGTITTVDHTNTFDELVCPSVNSNGSPLIKSELHIIKDVLETIQFPWLLIVLGLLVLMSQKNR